MTPETEAEVNRLLAGSRAAHLMKKRTAGVVDREGNVVAPPDWPTAEKHIVQALSLRLQAHELDPEHQASGWSIPIPPATSVTPDAELIQFYVAYSRPFISRQDMALVLKRFPAYAEVKYIP